VPESPKATALGAGIPYFSGSNSGGAEISLGGALSATRMSITSGPYVALDKSTTLPILPAALDALQLKNFFENNSNYMLQNPATGIFIGHAPDGLFSPGAYFTGLPSAVSSTQPAGTPTYDPFVTFSTPGTDPTLPTYGPGIPTEVPGTFLAFPESSVPGTFGSGVPGILLSYPDVGGAQSQFDQFNPFSSSGPFESYPADLPGPSFVPGDLGGTVPPDQYQPWQVFGGFEQLQTFGTDASNAWSSPAADPTDPSAWNLGSGEVLTTADITRVGFDSANEFGSGGFFGEGTRSFTPNETSNVTLNILELRDAYADVPPADSELATKPIEDYKARQASANNLLRALSAMFAWSIPRDWRTDNPCDHVPKLKGGESYAPWPMRGIEHFRKHARPVLWWVAAHALYTGQRQGDVLAMMRSHVHAGEVRVIQEKTRKELWIPLHRDLRAVHEQMPRVSTHLLTSSAGTPWTRDGFRASWQLEMGRRIFAPLKRHRLVFHGLRKSAVVMLLEAGCTTAQVQAITGQSLDMVEHYAGQVNQRKLARAAILKWEQAGR
jgi:integrase